MPKFLVFYTFHNVFILSGIRSLLSGIRSPSFKACEREWESKADQSWGSAGVLIQSSKAQYHAGIGPDEIRLDPFRYTPFDRHSGSSVISISFSDEECIQDPDESPWRWKGSKLTEKEK